MDDLMYIRTIYAHVKGYSTYNHTEQGIAFPKYDRISNRLTCYTIYISRRRRIAKFGAPTGSMSSSFSEE